MHEKVEFLREQVLTQKEGLFVCIQHAVPAISLNLARRVVAQAPWIRKYNNYLLVPDKDSVEIESVTHQITYVKKFSYQGKLIFPAKENKFPGATATRATLTPEGNVNSMIGSEQNCDFAMTLECAGITIMGLADGCGGKRSQTSAILAVQVALSFFEKQMQDKAPSTLQDVVRYQLQAFEAVQLDLKNQSVITANTTLQLAAIVDDYFVTASVGDTKAFITRQGQNQALTCIDVTDDRPFVVDSERDPGGYLGAGATTVQNNKSNSGCMEGADYRNLRIGVIKLQSRDMIHMVSDGTYACFDPLYLNLKPSQVDDSLQDQQWNETTLHHFHLRQQYMRKAFSELIKNCHNPSEVAKAFDDYVERMARDHKLAQITGASPIPPGKPDHANSIHVFIS